MFNHFQQILRTSNQERWKSRTSYSNASSTYVEKLSIFIELCLVFSLIFFKLLCSNVYLENEETKIKQPVEKNLNIFPIYLTQNKIKQVTHSDILLRIHSTTTSRKFKI